jgi:hypothetical protein
MRNLAHAVPYDTHGLYASLSRIEVTQEMTTKSLHKGNVQLRWDHSGLGSAGLHWLRCVITICILGERTGRYVLSNARGVYVYVYGL